jgi:serine protease Do
MASRIADQLKSGGRVVRGYLGIYPQALTPELAESMETPSKEGIIVSQMEVDTPAAKAGLRQGDVIIEVNGQTIGSDVNAFRLRVADLPVGEEILLTVFRDGQRKKVNVVLGERPNAVVAGAPGAPPQADEWAGLRVEAIPADARGGAGGDDRGVIVTDVQPDSPAEDAGIQEGDVIREVGNVEISNLRDYRGAVTKYKEKKAVALLVKRGEQTLYVGLKP